MIDRYGSDPLAGDWRGPRRELPKVEALTGLVVERGASATDEGFVGAVVGIEKGAVRLEDRHGRVRLFPLGAGFLVEGEAVVLSVPAAGPRGALRTASGSVARRRSMASS